MKKYLSLFLVGVIVASIGMYSLSSHTQTNKQETIKIGIITALSGDNAAWGESTREGILLAEQELEREGIHIEPLFEDGQLNPATSLSAAHKLVELDRVQAIYSEFNPTSVAIAPFLASSKILHIYDAAVVSPLKNQQLTYKTYLDYQTGCRKIAEVLQTRGVKKIGVLKLGLEAGDLCLAGIQEIYADRLLIETYPPGTTDFRTALLKLTQDPDVGAIINASFVQETINSLKQLRELNRKQVFAGSLEDTPPELIQENASLLAGGIFFGLTPIEDAFVQKAQTTLSKKSRGNMRAFALGYLHIKQISHALAGCRQNLDCTDRYMQQSPPEESLGFQGFKNRIASFEIIVREL